MVDAPLSMTMTGARLMIGLDKAGCYSRRREGLSLPGRRDRCTHVPRHVCPLHYLFWARVSYHSIFALDLRQLMCE